MVADSEFEPEQRVSRGRRAFWGREALPDIKSCISIVSLFLITFIINTIDTFSAVKTLLSCLASRTLLSNIVVWDNAGYAFLYQSSVHALCRDRRWINIFLLGWCDEFWERKLGWGMLASSRCLDRTNLRQNSPGSSMKKRRYPSSMQHGSEVLLPSTLRTPTQTVILKGLLVIG